MHPPRRFFVCYTSKSCHCIPVNPADHGQYVADNILTDWLSYIPAIPWIRLNLTVQKALCFHIL